MLVKHHGCWETVVSSLNGNYRYMAKQFQDNSKVKVFSNDSIVNVMNYFHRIE